MEILKKMLWNIIAYCLFFVMGVASQIYLSVKSRMPEDKNLHDFMMWIRTNRQDLQNNLDRLTPEKLKTLYHQQLDHLNLISRSYNMMMEDKRRIDLNQMRINILTSIKQMYESGRF